MASVTDIWSYRGLIGNLAQRELRSKYKRSFLGWSWSLINPAASLLIYTVVFGTVLRVEPPTGGNGRLQSFALFLFAGLLIWNFFNSVVLGSMSALIGAGPLLKKVYFPPECPPIATMLTVLAQTGLESLILILAFVIAGNVSWTFFLFPFLLLLLSLFTIGLGLILSLVNVYLRDVSYLVAIAMSLLFYGTPIIYPFSLVEQNAPSWVVSLVRVNPLTQFVGASRDIFYLLKVPSTARILALIGTSTVTFLLGWWFFSIKSRDVSEEL